MPGRPQILAPPPVLFFIALILGGSLQYFRPRTVGLPFDVGMAIGMTMLLVAGSLGFSALWTMTKAKTTVHPYHSPTSLVTHGAFRLTRNPLYVTLVLVHLAIAIMADSIWLLLATILLIALLDFGVIRPEERHIESIFGADYLAYKARVRRWI
ncbi:MAG TPA: isoprenylcysteine carboxylmethyltransferase family protein [Thermoanaerobaculia bacterium]